MVYKIPWHTHSQSPEQSRKHLETNQSTIANHPSNNLKHPKYPKYPREPRTHTKYPCYHIAPMHYIPRVILRGFSRQAQATFPPNLVLASLFMPLVVQKLHRPSPLNKLVVQLFFAPFGNLNLKEKCHESLFHEFTTGLNKERFDVFIFTFCAHIECKAEIFHFFCLVFYTLSLVAMQIQTFVSLKKMALG